MTATNSIAAWIPPAILLVSLIPLGSSPAPAAAFTVFLIAATVAVALAREARRGNLAAAAAAALDGCNPVALLGFPVIALLQLVAAVSISGSMGPVSAVLESTAELSAFAFFFLLCRSALGQPRSYRIIIAALVMIAGIEAAYGLLNLLAGNEHLLMFRRWAYPDSATGTLVSRNHFAFLMEMLIPVVVVAIGGAGAVDPAGAATADRSEAGARRVLLLTCLVLASLALLFSRSRMGVTALLAAVVVVSGLNLAARPAGERAESSTSRALKLAVPVVLAIAAFIGLDPLLDRFIQAPRHLEVGRLPIWEATLRMIGDAPVFGQGWGCFGSLLSAYRDAPTGLAYEHAHNEYLQIFAEAGIPGLSLTAWLIAAFFRRLYRSLASPLSERQRTAVTALAVAVVSVLLHSTMDFGLRIPAVALTFVMIVALFVRVTETPELADPAALAPPVVVQEAARAARSGHAARAAHGGGSGRVAGEGRQ